MKSTIETLISGNDVPPLHFPPFEYDFRKQLLRKNGLPIRIKNLSLIALHYILLNRDRLVTYGELIRVLWGSNSKKIYNDVNKIVRPIAERLTVGQHKFIDVLDGRGYRFIEKRSDSSILTQSGAPSPTDLEPLSITETTEDARDRQANQTKFALSIDGIVLNSVGELIFGFASESDIAECRSSYERALEDFAFALVYGSDLLAKWERRDPKQAPHPEETEPAEHLIWSLSGIPYRSDKLNPAFHSDRIFKDGSDRESLLRYIRHMKVCMRQRRFVEWCRDWLTRESAKYLGNDKSLFTKAKDPCDFEYGKSYYRDEDLLGQIPRALGDEALGTLVNFVPKRPKEYVGRQAEDLYIKQARVRFVLENILTHLTTMYQYEKQATHSGVWRVPYGLRAELTKKVARGSHRSHLRCVLLSHALNYALHAVSISSDRVDIVHTLCDMRQDPPFRDIRAMLEELSLILWKDDDETERKANKFIDKIRRAGTGDGFVPARSSVLRELAQTDPDGYRERLYVLFPELAPRPASSREVFRGMGVKPNRGSSRLFLAA